MLAEPIVHSTNAFLFILSKRSIHILHFDWDIDTTAIVLEDNRITPSLASSTRQNVRMTMDGRKEEEVWKSLSHKKIIEEEGGREQRDRL